VSCHLHAGLAGNPGSIIGRTIIDDNYFISFVQVFYAFDDCSDAFLFIMAGITIVIPDWSTLLPVIIPVLTSVTHSILADKVLSIRGKPGLLWKV